MELTKVITVRDAKSYLRANYEEGTLCPCCGQNVKLYKRKLNSGMAATLIRMYQGNGKEYVNVKQFLKLRGLQNNHDWTLLHHWGLIEPKPTLLESAKEIANKKTSGIWRVTSNGIAFINNQSIVPKTRSFYNKKCVMRSTETTSIKEALGNKFDYEELMNF